jgi:hypothetical protein
MADDFSWEPVAGIATMAGRFHALAYTRVQSLSC